jgi:hypothetical protein
MHARLDDGAYMKAPRYVTSSRSICYILRYMLSISCDSYTFILCDSCFGNIRTANAYLASSLLPLVMMKLIALLPI